jgi:DNA modification methylase
MGMVENNDYRSGAGEYDLAMFDPPFKMWKDITWMPEARTYCCFTNFQNRRYVEDLFGSPKFEIIWYFKDGRWVSHKMPRLTHEHILIYGDLRNEAYTGEYNSDLTPVKKGRGCIGSDKNLGERIYTPRERKMLNSVIEVPRNVSKDLGVWGKPEGIVRPIMEWLCSAGDRVWDGFAGSGTFGVVAYQLGLKYEGYEIDAENCLKANERINRAKSNPHLIK